MDKYPARHLITSALLFLVLVLSGCGGGGGGGGSAATEDPTGIWQGTFTEAGFGTGDLLGFLINNQAYFISLSANTVYQGSYSMSGSTLSASATIYQINGGPLGTASMSATVSTGASITGNFNTSYNSSGTVSLVYDTLTDRGSSLATTDGNWSLTNGLYTVSMSIDANGALTGSDTDGCVYNGTISIIDSSKNIYRINATVSSCGISNGSYSGYAVISDTNSTNDTFNYVASNSSFLVFGELLRQ